MHTIRDGGRAKAQQNHKEHHLDQVYNDGRKQAIQNCSEKWKNADLKQLAVMIEDAKSAMGLSEQSRFSEDV